MNREQRIARIKARQSAIEQALAQLHQEVADLNQEGKDLARELAQVEGSHEPGEVSP